MFRYKISLLWRSWVSLSPFRPKLVNALFLSLTFGGIVCLYLYTSVVPTFFPQSQLYNKNIQHGADTSWALKWSWNAAPGLTSFSEVLGSKSIADLNVSSKFKISSIYESLKFPNLSDAKQWSPETGLKDSQLLDLQTLVPKFWSKENKLKIFVILHSHNDAGWGMTFEQYFTRRTRNILDNVLHFLSQNKELKFIWAEISFFSLWWKDLPSSKRKAVKKLVDSKQLEFVAGGWVMPDEANVHYLSYFTQLIEGHQFLRQHFNVSPRNGWAIDPFGLSTSFGFLQTRAGINNTVFMRAHYILKNFLRENKATEFIWRQQWDSGESGDIFSYLMPYGNYDLSYTCGPNVKICSSIFLDSRRKIPANKIALASMELLDQFRKKSQLFNTFNLMYPVGGDFHWSARSEWTVDLVNLKNVMKFINSREDLYTEMQFTTLDEYFTAVRSDIGQGNFQPKSLVGDFFTYSDATLDYWSGYFTSRVFHKATERQLMTSLRTAQLLFTLMSAEVSKHWGKLSVEFISRLLQILIQSRRDLSIFQHHDGITGTSADYVVMDYAAKMDLAMKGCQEVMMTSLFVLANLDYFKNGTLSLEEDTVNHSYIPTMHKDGDKRNMWKPIIFKTEAGTKNDSTIRSKIVTVFNPLETPHTKLIMVGVASPNVKVVTTEEEEVESEIFPIFLREDSPAQILQSPDAFGLHFVAVFKPLEIKHYKIVSIPEMSTGKVNIKILNVMSNFSNVFKQTFAVSPSEGVMRSEDADVIEISNKYFSVNFSSNGFAETVLVKNTGERMMLKISFKYYKSRTTSGLYSFFPEGVAKPIKFVTPVILVIQGKLKSYVEVWTPNVKHRLTLYNHKGLDSSALEITNTIDIRREKDYELMMHIGTEIASGDAFYTDSNGFQMMRRKRMTNLPIQGNYYPVASSAFIEDSAVRMTILAAQPGGGASLKSGELEIMQDRINFHDDNHGIGQGGTDNLKTVSKYKLILEPIQKFGKSINSFPTLSLESHRQLHNLLHPIQAFVKTSGPSEELSPKRYNPSVENYLVACDVLLVTSHILPEYNGYAKENDTSIFVHVGSKIGLLFHRVGYDGRFSSDSLMGSCSIQDNDLGTLNISQMFYDSFEKRLQQTTLSFSELIGDFENPQLFIMKSMEVYAFTARFKNLTGDPWASLVPLNLPS